jgi:hypothetical protein
MRVVSDGDPNKPALQGIEFCGLRRVTIAIHPVDGGNDGRGLPLHCRWTVRRIPRDARIHEGLGRASGFDASNQAPIVFESDGGSYLVRPGMGLELIGGARNWDVEINDAGELWDAPQWFWLTQLSKEDGGTGPTPEIHTSFRAIGGTWQTSLGFPIDNMAIIPTAIAMATAGAAFGVFQTGIEL